MNHWRIGETAGASKSTTSVLLVSPDESMCLTISEWMQGRRGWVVEQVPSEAEAVAALTVMRFSLLVCEVDAPGEAGLRAVRHFARMDPDLAVVMLTAVNDAPTATEALIGGAMDYLVKPVELAQLGDAVERALHKRELNIQRRAFEQMIRDEVESQTRALDDERTRLHALSVSIAEALVTAMEAKDVYLRGHSQRVAELAASIADELGLDEDTIEAVRLAGRLCDVGKIGIRESVLNKPGALTPEEFEHVKDHVRIGMEILAPLHHLGLVLDYVQDHHEHVDGTGYPNRKPAEAITIGGKILAAADAFTALTSPRAFRGALAHQAALEVLRDSAGSRLDAAAYSALVAVVSRNRVLTFISPCDA